MRFDGKSILITGAASGIGKAAAELIAREGAVRLVLLSDKAATITGSVLISDGGYRL